MDSKTGNYLAFRARQIPMAIDNALESAVNQETGEIVDETAIAQVQSLLHEQQVTVADLGEWVRWAEDTRIGEIKMLMDRLKKEKARFEKAATFCRAAIRDNLKPGEVVKTDFVRIGWRKSTGTICGVEPVNLAPEYQRVKVEANIEAIKKALQSGEEIPGCYLEERQGIVIS